MKIYELIEDLHALQFRTQAYERKYGVTSQDFYELYRQGGLDDEGFERSTEFARWASAYEMQDDSSLAGTFPHHKHAPPDIKHHRVLAPGIRFDHPNLPALIEEIERDLLSLRARPG